MTVSLNIKNHPSANPCVLKCHGFSLIEVSISIVVIGLIVGGTLAGRDLINASKLQAVISDIEKYQAAAINFKTKYNCLPGDCRNASEYFGVYNGAGGCYPGAYSTTAATISNQSTCNGNGDGKIWYLKPGDPYFYSWEKNRFWQHLSAAGLVAEQYAGIANMDGGQADHIWASGKRGWNMPASKWKDATYSVVHFPSSGEYYTATTNNKNKFIIGNETRCLGWTPCAFDIYAGITNSGPVFTGLEARQIDTKMDDGKPGTGKVTGLHYNQNGFGLFCGTNVAETLAEYRTFTAGWVTPDVASCPLYIDAGF